MSTDERNGVLAAAAWSAAIASRAEPARYRRGKEYLRENAIVALDIEPGEIHGSVLGSRPLPYRVTITVPAIRGPVASLNALVPGARSLVFKCTCPDWDEPCKHGVAVGLAFAERLRIEPDALARLRLGDPGVAVVPPDPDVALPPGGRHLSVVRAAPGPAQTPALAPEIAAFLEAPSNASGSAEPLVLEPLVMVRLAVGAVDVGEFVNDAMHWLSVLHRSS